MSATKLARFMVRSAIEAGVVQWVVSPGSRNAPLSLALYQAQKRGLIELFVRIDERSAAFFALGLAKSSDSYVGLVCTSGTAVANYHPAVLEAYHANNKLLVMSADRPEKLRRTGANQTTLHAGLLAPLSTIDTSIALPIGEHLDGGPVHVNLQFEEPLLDEPSSEWLAGIQITEAGHKASGTTEHAVTPRTLLVIGHDRGGFSIDEIREKFASTRIPMVAEDPLSFSEAVPHAALFLSDPKIRAHFAPEEVIVIGRTTLSRSINALIAGAKRTVVIDPRTESIDTHRSATEIYTTLPSIMGEQDNDWVSLWSSLKEFGLSLPDWSEQLALRAICEQIPNDSSLFVSSSRPIRDIEGFAAPRSGLKTFANRGLAGIDGNISTALGIAVNSKRTYAVIGDITFLHDVSALASVPEVNLTIFLIDNNGGGIFNTLEQAGSEGFETVFGTPHNLNLESVVRGFGVSCEVVHNAIELNASLAEEVIGLKIILVRVPDRQTNAAGIKQTTQSLVSALLTGANLA